MKKARNNDSTRPDTINMKYLNSLNHYRAISILLIVAGHCYGLAGIEFDSFPENIIKNLITGGTINFVFISGFLFYSVFYQRFEYVEFLKGKIKKVLMPYVFLSIPAILLFFYRGSGTSGMANTDYTYVETIFEFLISGKHLIAYWYIPFIMLVFLVSPMHIYFIKLNF